MWFQERIIVFLYLPIVLSARAQQVPVNTTVIFTAVSPKTIRPHSTYSVVVNVESGPQSGGALLAFTTSIGLLGAKEPLFSSEQIQVQPGDSVLVSVAVHRLPEATTTFQLTLRGFHVNEQRVVFDESTSIVKDDTKVKSLLIQTDKPIYKPGDTVLFRLVALNRLLRPIQNQTVDITVVDSQQNIIKQWSKQPLGLKGLLSSKLELSSQPNLGDWTLRALFSSGETKTIQFRVDEYVLPKFKVDVRLPTFLTHHNSKLLVEIQAAYTYGKQISGSAEVTLWERVPYRPQHRIKSVLKKVPVTGNGNGSAFIEFDVVKELFAPSQELHKTERELVVKVTVIDGITGRMQNTSSSVKIYEHQHKIQQIREPANWKPGFPLELTFSVTAQDGTPVSDHSPKAIKIAHGFAFKEQDGILYFPIPPTGIVKVVLTMPTNPLMYFAPIEVTYKGVVATFYPPEKLLSPSGTYMEVTLLTQVPTSVGSNLAVHVKSSKPFNGVNYLLFGRGQLLTSTHVPTVGRAMVTEFNFSVPITQAAAPEARLLVYVVVKPGNKITVDSKTFKVGGTLLDNHLTIGLSKANAEPNEKINVRVVTQAGSLVALRGIEESITLLQEDRDITMETIEDEIKAFQKPFSKPRMWAGSNAFQLFDAAGLVVLTNGKLEPAELRLSSPPFSIKSGGCSVLRSGSGRGPGGGGGGARGGFSFRRKEAATQAPPQHRVRTHFPETFPWHEFETNSSLSTLALVVPDTLTSWLITGYSLHTDFGIGVSLAPTVLETFRPFFLTLNVPYSIVHGETVSLEVVVHNYLQATTQSADISLRNDKNEFVFSDSPTKRVQIDPNSVQLVTFTITPTKFGVIKLDVRGVTAVDGQVAGDALAQPLIVKPPGRKRTQTRTTLLDPKGQANYHVQLNTEYPAERVQGADVVKLTVVADLLGPTISNIDKLLQLPCGCGEQNMLNFVPDIVVLDYLTTLGTLTSEIKAKALHFLEVGYQRQLTYKHPDGSFSAFGVADPQGSTWLTAFVVRSFIQATPWIAIDQGVVSEALMFLARKQGEDGSFAELGDVVNSEVQGGTASSAVVLSAYVLLAFIEAKTRNLTIAPETGPNSSEEFVESGESRVFKSYNMDDVITLGLRYLACSFDDAKGDAYSLHLIAYTLTVAGRPESEVFVQRLEQLAHRDLVTQLLHWKPSHGKHGNESHQQTKPISIEMSSYGLMTFMARNDLDNALAIGRWLLQQRNSQGGFLSTQDTVVGLTALAKFAIATRRPDGTDLSIRASYQGGPEIFAVNDTNAIVLQEVILPGGVQNVDLEVKGRGTALATLSWSYYVETEAQADAPFTISAEVSALTEVTIQLAVSTSFCRSKPSNMAVLEVNLPSGYVFDDDRLPGKLEKVVRVELEDGATKLQLYFDHLTSTRSVIKLYANRLFKVENSAKAYITVYDYYDTTLTTTEFYTIA